MTDKLPANLLALFQPRPALRYIPPQDTAPEERALKKSQISGVAAFLPALEEYKQTDEYYPTESWLQRRDRLKAEKRLIGRLTSQFRALCRQHYCHSGSFEHRAMISA